MKRTVSLLLAALLLMACFAAPTMAEAAEPVEIEFWHIYPADVSAALMTSMIEAYQVEYPNVTVKELGISFWDYTDKLTPALAAGTGPDIFINDLGNVESRAMNGQLMDLQSYVDAAGFDLDLYLPASVAQCTYDGHLYGFPFITDTRVLYWNKTHFAEVGLDPEAPPTTWAEVMEYNEKLTTFKDDARTEVDRMGFSTRLGNFYEWTLAWTCGADLFDDNDMPTFQTPEMFEALDVALKIQDQVGLNAFNIFSEASKSLSYSPFIAEQVSMIVETNELYGQIKNYNPDMDFGVALIPTLDGVNNKASWGNGFSLELVDKGEARAQAAFDLGAFLCRTDNAIGFINGMQAFVCNAEALNDKEVLSDPVWAVFAESGAVTRFRDFVAEYPTWYGSLTPEWESALKLEKTPEEALASAEADVIQEIENYKMMNGI